VVGREEVADDGGAVEGIRTRSAATSISATAASNVSTWAA
jgi:hypothetical protein